MLLDITPTVSINVLTEFQKTEDVGLVSSLSAPVREKLRWIFEKKMEN